MYQGASWLKKAIPANPGMELIPSRDENLETFEIVVTKGTS